MRKTRITQIVTHERPHLDEITARFALIREGKDQYSNVRNADIVVFDPKIHVDERSEEEWEQEGTLFVGVREGRFDDHPHTRYPDDCALTLVLKHLRADQDPSWKWLAGHVKREDKHGATDALHLATVIKAMSRTMTAGEVIRHVDPMLEALLEQQRSFSDAVRIAAGSWRSDVENPNTGKTYRLVVVDDCDNEDVARAARWEHGTNAALVIHRNTKGHVYISSSRRQGITRVGWLVAQLRYKEQARDRSLDHVSEFRARAVDGALHRWYHHEEGGAIYSGSLTSPNSEITHLPLEEIRAIAIEFLAGFKQTTQTNGGQQTKHRQVVAS